jgi:medium-chain acyl-[acyl-carrier-protein] hydrolase
MSNVTNIESVARGSRVERSLEIDLWCLACAGGSSFSFSGWNRKFENNIHIAPLELAGRGRRLSEKPMHHVREVVDDLLPVIASTGARRFAFFGHSMGSLIAIECCWRLEALGRVAEHLFVGAGVPPHLFPFHRKSIHGSSDERIISYLRALRGTPPEVLSDRDFMVALLPAIRADFRLLETYCCPKPSKPLLRCPITVFAAANDDIVSSDVASQWREYTSGPFNLQVVESDHFAISRSRTVIETIQARLFSRET